MNATIRYYMNRYSNNTLNLKNKYGHQMTIDFVTVYTNQIELNTNIMVLHVRLIRKPQTIGYAIQV